MLTLNKKIYLPLIGVVALGLIVAAYFIFLKPRWNLSVMMPQVPVKEKGGFEVLDSPAFKKLKSSDKFLPATTTGRENPFMELQ